MDLLETHIQGSDDMGPKPGYVSKVREGKAAILIYLDAPTRTAFKHATEIRGTSMQAELVRYITEYASEYAGMMPEIERTVKRSKRKK